MHVPPPLPRVVVMERLNSPVVVGAIIGLAFFLGFWSGHVMTFRTAYYFTRERGDGE